MVIPFIHFFMLGLGSLEFKEEAKRSPSFVIKLGSINLACSLIFPTFFSNPVITHLLFNGLPCQLSLKATKMSLVSIFKRP
ncbi:hypothetical protein ID0642_13530 [Helicobacter pylori]